MSNQESKDIVIKGLGSRIFRQGLEELQKLNRKGYVLDTDKRIKLGVGRAYFSVKKTVGEAEETSENLVENTPEIPQETKEIPLSLDDSYKDIKNKRAMLKWATDRGITVPEDKKAPTAVKKFLKDYVEAQDGI